MNKRLKKYLLITIFLVIIFLLFSLLKNSQILNIDYLQNYVNSFGMAAPLVFIAIYILFSLTGVPATLLTIAAGIIFGLFYGLIYVVIAATLAATIAFYIARYFRHLFHKDKFKSKTLTKIVNKIELHAEKKGFYVIAILRLSFMPFIPLSYASGLVRKLKAKDFILATLLTDIIGSFVFIYLGFSLTKSIPLFVTGIILFLVLMEISHIIKKRHEKKLSK